ncbi:MAG: hypothetical protein MMC23_004530 [Stictis urceolatum]|nr:hypothetical protein [Stictis urceolata]
MLHLTECIDLRFARLSVDRPSALRPHSSRISKLSLHAWKLFWVNLDSIQCYTISTTKVTKRYLSQLSLIRLQSFLTLSSRPFEHVDHRPINACVLHIAASSTRSSPVTNHTSRSSQNPPPGPQTVDPRPPNAPSGFRRRHRLFLRAFV